ncbi:hypothetical protein L9F63_024030 [Diploptera punctata]|uniref:Uncharacterized protein n=1 Tax=Diploptera punctata TaxID=6984 RepID=A0AAD7ZHH0_DIPPU|nr:hypothetical protein L9F63_024030 [Diploptera punctata]
MVVIKMIPKESESEQGPSQENRVLVYTNPVNNFFKTCLNAMSKVLIMIIRAISTVVFEAWMVTEILLNLVLGPTEYLLILLTNPHGVAMFWIIVEVFFEVGISVIFAGVTVFMSAILLLEDAFNADDDGRGDDNKTQSLLKKVRTKVRQVRGS